MAPIPDTLSPPGSSSYSSDTMTVGDGTWDFTKNTFLLPNLVGLNFETMQYNGMGNRFSSMPQYHAMILAHGVLAAITFLFIIPIAILTVRFYASAPGYAVRYHAYLQVLAVGFTTVIFILGFFAVGPPRNLTNPHHGIGVAIYVLILLQAVGGRLVKHIRGRSLRLHLHKWSGRLIALLGMAQVPLGLCLYGSPKVTFILYAVWMAFLVFLYFVLDYRDQGRREFVLSGGRSDGGGMHSRVTEDRRSSKKGGGMGWLGPLAAGAGIMALMRGRRKNRDRDTERGHSRSPSPSNVTSHRHRHESEVIPSPRGSDSYFDEKSTNVHSRRRESGGGGGGFMKTLLGVGAGLGAGALVGRMLGRRNSGRRGDESEYSAVATDTPSRVHRPRRNTAPPTEYSDYSDLTQEPRRHSYRDHGRRSPLLPPPGDPVTAAAAISASEPRPVARPPMTPQRSHGGRSRFESIDGSDYSSYVSPSRRPSTQKKSGGVGKGILAGIGLGWFAKKAKDRRDRREERLRDEEDRRMEEEERRAGNRTSRYTGDGYPTPTRRESQRRRPTRPRPAPSATTVSAFTEESSTIEAPSHAPYDPAPVGGGARPPPAPVPVPGAPPMAPPPTGPVPVPVPVPINPAGRSSRSQSASRHDNVFDPVLMPPMPDDPRGVLHESGSETYFSSGGRPHRRHSTRRGRRGNGDPEAAAAAAAASASLLAAQVDEERQRRGESPLAGPSGQPVSVKVKVHDDRDRNITLRRLTEEEMAASQRRDHSASQAPGGRRRRNDSVSSVGSTGYDTPTGGGRRYRREGRPEARDNSRSSTGRAEAAAESHVEGQESSLAAAPPPPPPPFAPLSPPNPAFVQGGGGAGRGRAGNKDSAYYSGGQAGPSGQVPAAGATMSSLGGSPAGGTHATWSAITPSPGGPQGSLDHTPSAADRRRRRRLERRDGSSRPATATVDFE
ncbi:hypothetical protein QBC46DRAFT_313940 [Diplogelasinospora grovesii]|uniref:Cytochrome b561 domain-containing protein n=1 Tax=Diplogelasinospora grovesii TaxID=303347 RepID=A0AAN6N740_9PEZI|nr:hypothetical protein QBC46DRAFT_313940 [Diplogelasinospora grovesii]